jgi:3-oxoacyl-[acyl-carrier-protein] synthase-3
VPLTVGVRMAGVGHYVPERVMTNADFEKILDTTDEWIVSRTGMHERHIARDDETTSDMGLAAAKMALERAGCKAADIGCVIVATVTPDYLFPATASVLAAKLGIAGTAAFDMEIACSGFIYGLTVASSLIQAGVYGRILLVGSEKLSSITNYSDRGTAVLFGDGAGAVVLEAQELAGTREDRGILTVRLRSDGRHKSKLYVDGGPSSTGTVGHLRMEGREVFRHAVAMITDVVEDAFKATGYTVDDINWFVPHQANKRIIDGSAHKLGIAPSKVVTTVDRHGNTSAASIPLALADAVADRRIKRGDLLLLEAMGGGFTWAAALLRW